MGTWKASVLLTFLVMESTTWGAGDNLKGPAYHPARALAMGDAYIAQADDGASALMYNPAMLGKLRRFEFEMENIQLEANSDFVERASTKMVTFPSLAAFAPTLAGRSFWAPGAGGSYFPNVSTRGFGAGVLFQSRVWGQNKNGTLRYRSTFQMIPTAGVALRLASGVVKVGYSFQWINKAQGDQTVGWSEAQGWFDRVNSGHAFSHTGAFSLNIPRTYLPSINIVARNIGGTKYKSGGLAVVATNVTGQPETDPMMIDVGLGIGPRLSGSVTSTINLDYRDVTAQTGVFLLTKASAGLELAINQTVYLRAGYGAGYPSAGLGIHGHSGRLSFAWWSEELSTSIWSERDNRFMVQYQFKIYSGKSEKKRNE